MSTSQEKMFMVLMKKDTNTFLGACIASSKANAEAIFMRDNKCSKEDLESGICYVIVPQRLGIQRVRE